MKTIAGTVKKQAPYADFSEPSENPTSVEPENRRAMMGAHLDYLRHRHRHNHAITHSEILMMLRYVDDVVSIETAAA